MFFFHGFEVNTYRESDFVKKEAIKEESSLSVDFWSIIYLLNIQQTMVGFQYDSVLKITSFFVESLGGEYMACYIVTYEKNVL